MLMGQPVRRRETPAQARHRNFRSDMGPYPVLAGKGMKSGGAVNPVTVQQGHGRHIEFGGTLDKVFGQRCSFQKAESAGRMEFDVTVSHTAPRPANVPA